MLPEQIWDEPDLPKTSMRFGGPTGAATPLVWAHAEYLSLLRSVTDGKVFDRIAAVEERYCNGKPKDVVEIFKLDRKIERMTAGKRLRILADSHFLLRWSPDDWSTVNNIESRHIGYAGHVVDIETETGQQGRIGFTFAWLPECRWEGRNFAVELEP
jgi:glucoamylase